MMLLKQSTAVDVKIGPFLDATDGVTAETALTISQADVRLAKNGGAWAQKNDSNAATHEENGWYECALNTTDTGTLGILKLAVHESGAIPVWHDFMVVPAEVYDYLVAGTDNFTVDLTSTAQTAAADALLKRDMSAVSGESDRSPLNALRLLRNKWTSSGGTLTVYEEDDTTSAWTASLTENASANPVTGSDPA
jgi:hypothetical protein